MNKEQGIKKVMNDDITGKWKDNILAQQCSRYIANKKNIGYKN